MTLRIAVDAGSLSEETTGIARYTFETLSHMSRLGHKWYLYSHRPIPTDYQFGSNVCVRHLNIQTRGLGMLWAQTVLPYWAQQNRTDLFWSPAHRIPQLLSHKITRVVTIHDLVWAHAGQTMRPLSRWMDKLMVPGAVRHSDRIISVSEHTARDLAREFPYAREKIRVVKEGVTLSNGPPSSADSLEWTGRMSKPYVLFVGTLEPRKNLDRLIVAYAQLPDEARDIADLVIVGGKGWGGVDPEGWSRQHGVAHRVKVLGYVTDAQLFTLYSNALFLAMPSLYEGFGLPLLEAMSRGIPVLTSNVSSMPEVAGEAAILVDPMSVESISDGLKKLLWNEGLRITLGEAAKKRASQFTWELTARKIFDVFQEAVDTRRECLDKKLRK